VVFFAFFAGAFFVAMCGSPPFIMRTDGINVWYNTTTKAMKRDHAGDDEKVKFAGGFTPPAGPH
jgi:hypothetical protein